MDAFQALADPVRRDLIRRMADAPRSVTELAAGHDISRPAISRHLRVLREAGLVTVTVQGRQRLHALDHDGLRPVAELLAGLRPAAVRVSSSQLDALDIEVRRTRRERDEASRTGTQRQDTA